MVYRTDVSRTVYLATDWGSPDKTLKIFKYNDSGSVKYVLLFHIKERYGDDYKNNDTLTIVADGNSIKKELVNDASVIVADLSDLYFYARITESDYNTMMNAEKVEFLIMKYRFQLGAECKTVIAF